MDQWLIEVKKYVSLTLPAAAILCACFLEYHTFILAYFAACTLLFALVIVPLTMLFKK